MESRSTAGAGEAAGDGRDIAATTADPSPQLGDGRIKATSLVFALDH